MAESTPSSSLLGLNVTVVSAKLGPSGILFKPDPYVELSVDGGVPVKTEYSKSTFNPKWDEQFSVLVTPYSKLHFRVFNHSSLMKDGLLGECALDLYSVLSKHSGHLDHLPLPLEISGGKAVRNSSYLLTVLDGLHVDITRYPLRGLSENPDGIIQHNHESQQNGIFLPDGNHSPVASTSNTVDNNASGRFARPRTRRAPPVPPETNGTAHLTSGFIRPVRELPCPAFPPVNMMEGLSVSPSAGSVEENNQSVSPVSNGAPSASSPVVPAATTPTTSQPNY